MKIVIDLDENVLVRLYDNGIDMSKKDLKLICKSIRNGKPCREFGTLPYDDDNTTCMVCPVCGSVWEEKNEDSN